MKGQKVDANWLNNHYLEAKLVTLNERRDASDHPIFLSQHHIQPDQFDFHHYYSMIDLNAN